MTSTDKYVAEKLFWKEEQQQYIKWYRGSMRELYGVNAPTIHSQITRHDTEFLNALDTWCNHDKWRYCKHLFVEPTYFSGKKILEVGCGPLGLSRWFIGADIYGIDPLHSYYGSIGYPTDTHNITYENCWAESMPYEDNTFDAVISVNAIDHVDNFEQVCKEIVRVLKLGGEIRIETHYHKPTTTEPHTLDNNRVSNAFAAAYDIKYPAGTHPEIVDIPRVWSMRTSKSALFYPRGTHPESDDFVLWSNRGYMYDAFIS